jgi:hypothetical protein
MVSQAPETITALPRMPNQADIRVVRAPANITLDLAAMRFD